MDLTPARRLGAAILVGVLACANAASAAGSQRGDTTTVAIAAADPAVLGGWRWPVSPPRIVAPFVAPPHAYGPGHRGIDLAAGQGAPVASPAPGVVAFAGMVAGRGIVTIDHGAGLVTTLEPVQSSVDVGASVVTGAVVGSVDGGGHAAPGTVHFGVRRDGEYVNPLLLLGGIPRAVLLPCC